ncbi:hypothetical protein [Aliidongia dinghuensis]|nr:hypothetical protein [Aliidongia dinghuensis]
MVGIGAAMADDASQPMSTPQGTPEMFGTWTVTKVLCSDCQGRKTPEIGTQIVISDDSFNDPFSTNCATGASYPNRQLPWLSAIKLFKLPKGAHALASPKGTITDARLNCDDGPYARVLFIGQDRAIYIYEGEDYLIERAKTP